MAIDYRSTCDKCETDLFHDGDEIYCYECWKELLRKIDELEARIKELESHKGE